MSYVGGAARDAARQAQEAMAEMNAKLERHARDKTARSIRDGVHGLHAEVGEVSALMGSMAEASAAMVTQQERLVGLQVTELEHMREQVALMREQREAAAASDAASERRARQSLTAAWISIGVAIVSVGVAVVAILTANG